MKSYGQFCSIARALDLLGERWTLLVVRELLCGSQRFGDIQRGIPRISRTMLSARLRELCDAGVIERYEDAGPAYRLTTAGQELAPLVMELGSWGQRWLSRALDESHLDMDALLWDMRRRVRMDALPPEPVVMRIELADLSGPNNRRFLLLRRAEVSLCASNPGYPEELCLHADRRTLVAWWRGDLSLAAARRAGMSLEGKRALVQAFPTWFERYLLADVQPVHASAS